MQSHNSRLSTAAPPLVYAFVCPLFHTVCVPISALAATPASPTKAPRRNSGGRLPPLLRNLGKMLRAAPNLCTLEFTGINVSPLEIKTLAAGLTGNQTLTSVTFRRVLLLDEGASVLLPALSTLNATSIILSHVGMTDKSRYDLTHMVKAHCCRRDELTWAISLRGREGVCPSASTAPEDIGRQGVLALDLSKNALGDETAVAMAHALIHDGWLLGLNMSDNKIGMVGATSLCEMLIQNRFIKAIRLDNCPCFKKEKGKEGMLMMANLLRARDVGEEGGVWEGVWDVLEEWRGGEVVPMGAWEDKDLHAQTTRFPLDNAQGEGAADEEEEGVNLSYR